MYVWSNHPCSDGFPEVAPGGKFKPNAFGLFDMLGNLREWVEDRHHASYAGAPSDGSAWQEADCGKRIVRGGSWIDGFQTTRAAYRHTFEGAHRSYQAGFRVVRDITP